MAALIPSGLFRRPWLPALAGAVLVLAAVAAYSRSLQVPFLFDDAPAIERNTTIRQLWPLSEVLSPPQTAAGATGRPIVNLTLALNYAAHGLNPRGFHLFNLVVHALAGLTLFGLVRRTLLMGPLRGQFGDDALPVSLATAGLWLVHPLLTEAVICVVQRSELLVGLFYLLTLYLFARSVTAEQPGRWRILVVGACLLGMASKEVMATAPLLVLLYDRTFVAGTFRESWRQRRGFYLALAATWLPLAMLVLRHQQRAGTVGFGLGVSPWHYLLTQCQALTLYLKLSLWPHPLVLDYGVGVAQSLTEIWPQGLLVIALLAATALALWRRPVLGFAGAWFFVILAPSSSFLPLTTQPIAEHRMYLPLAAVLALAVAGFRALLDRADARICTTLVAIFGLGWLTLERSNDYRSEEAIWLETIAQQPLNARAHASLGHVRAVAGQWNDALAHYAEAIRLRPDYADAQSDYASILLKISRAPEALPHLEAALRLKPDDDDIRYNLAVAQAQTGHMDEARGNLETVLKQNPFNSSAWNNLGDILLKIGRQAGAVTAFEEALRIDPRSAAAHNNAGTALVSLRRWPEALRHYADAIQLEPENPTIHSNYGDALFQMGNPTEAANEYHTALRLSPELAVLHYKLGNVWLQMSRLADAVCEFEETLRLQPDFPPAQHNLGLALVQLGRPAEALAHYQETLRQLPGSAATHHSLAVALAQLGRNAEAISHDDEALRLQPDFPAAREHRQKILEQR